MKTRTGFAREARRRGWWLPWNGVIPSWAVTYIGLESEAAEVMEFQPFLVPGLLQTEGHTEAIFRAAHPDESDEHIKRQIELRMPGNSGKKSSGSWRPRPAASTWKKREVQYYASLYQHLSASALSVQDLARMISDIAETI